MDEAKDRRVYQGELHNGRLRFSTMTRRDAAVSATFGHDNVYMKFPGNEYKRIELRLPPLPANSKRKAGVTEVRDVRVSSPYTAESQPRLFMATLQNQRIHYEEITNGDNLKVIIASSLPTFMKDESCGEFVKARVIVSEPKATTSPASGAVSTSAPAGAVARVTPKLATQNYGEVPVSDQSIAMNNVKQERNYGTLRLSTGDANASAASNFVSSLSTQRLQAVGEGATTSGASELAGGSAAYGALPAAKTSARVGCIGVARHYGSPPTQRRALRENISEQIEINVENNATMAITFNPVSPLYVSFGVLRSEALPDRRSDGVYGTLAMSSDLTGVKNDAVIYSVVKVDYELIGEPITPETMSDCRRHVRAMEARIVRLEANLAAAAAATRSLAEVDVLRELMSVELLHKQMMQFVRHRTQHRVFYRAIMTLMGQAFVGFAAAASGSVTVAAQSRASPRRRCRRRFNESTQ